MIHPLARVRRRTLLGAGLTLPAAAVLAGCGDDAPEASANPDGPPDQVTFLTSFQQFGRDSYPYLALESGMFADRGLDVTIEPGSGTVPNMAGLLSGRAQFAAFDLAGAAVVYGNTYEGDEPQVAGEPLQGCLAIAAIHQQPLGTVMAYADSGISTPEDLVGRSVGMPPGALTGLMFPAYLSAAGIDPADVEIVELEPAALTSALAAGQVDGIGQFVVGRPLVERAGGGREVVVLPYADLMPDPYGIGLFTTAELVQSDPDLCARVRDGVLAGLQAAIDDPAAAAEALAKHAPETDLDVAAAEMELMAPYSQVMEPDQMLGHIDDARMLRHVSVLVSSAGADPGLTPEDLVAFDLLPRPEGDS